MAVIGWGKPTIVFSKYGSNAAWSKMQNPVQDSTQLSTEKGNKTEALCEGGVVEDVKYDKNKYSLAMTIRVKKGATQPIPHDDGVVNDEYVVALQPEDPAVPGILIQKSHVSVEDGWASSDGTTFIYTFDALVPDDESNQVKHGVIGITANQQTGAVSAVTITQLGENRVKTVSPSDGSLTAAG